MAFWAILGRLALEILTIGAFLVIITAVSQGRRHGDQQ